MIIEFEEIRLKNSGFESIEVVDDGTGIEPDSFDSVCKPHSTSKLTGLSDFNQLVTLGFRGEALNALCALASVTVISRSKSASIGTKLSFDHGGNIVDQSSIVRPIGTTVIIERLFETLPVRRKEFEKTSKKQLGKILTTVQCFALSRPDVKFVCSNTLSGKRVQLICTTGKDTIRELVYNLFGGRDDKNRMINIVQCLPNDEVCSMYGLNNPDSLISGQSNKPSLAKSSSVRAATSFCGVSHPKRSKTEDCGLKKSLAERLKTLDDFSFKPLSRDKCMDVLSSRQLDRSQAKYEASRSPIIGMDLSCNDSFANSPAPELSDVGNCDHERRKFNPPLMRNLSRGFENTIEKDTVVIEKMEKAMEQNELPSDVSNQEQDRVEQQRSVLLATNVEPPSTFFRPQQKVLFSMTSLRQRMSSLRSLKAKEEQASQDLHFSVSLLPGENETAEQELSRTLKKSDFCQMSIIGQFNKGFIITHLRNHLFIIDQHASDEKYNFERFQKKARVDSQRLIQPKALELGAVQALTLRDNKEIFEANGFGFEFQNGEDGYIIPHLVSTPVLHSWNFDNSDIEEILAVVSEFPGVMYRPAKLRRIFASRACRKSVMIGTVLSTSQMQNIIHHLGTLDQPWNCPHGRPTLRHLVDLRNIK